MFGTRSARYGQLLLFAALLFGIFTMHTVGHPAEHGGRGGAAAPMAAAGHAAAAPMAVAHAAAAPEAAAAHPDLRRPVHPAPMRGMDPMAVCLAVLSVWGLALLTALMAARRPASGLPRTTVAGSSRRPRPPPPPRPRKAVLTGLSVLRI
ncbi:hypothetical protein [Streptomyces sp. AC154]|uniref:hypothetical protein n=1 Tax=Streptomyces sp. AC154 TaxID=3143184 RepID=UPI003F8151B5